MTEQEHTQQPPSKKDDDTTGIELVANAEKNEQLKNDNLQIQLTALRNQLNPHFLFNSLNTLSWLINEDKNKSQLYLQKLSQVLRYSLSMQEQSFVSLKEEMALTDSFIFLLQKSSH
jgi:LytS/YehU family sensor histidine kinase